MERLQIPEPDHGYPPFKGHYFKTVFCFDVLEHMINPLFILDRIHEYMALDGQLFLTLPAALNWPFARDKQDFHEMHQDEIHCLLLRSRFKFQVKARCGTEMLSLISIGSIMRYFCRKRFFIHASPDWSKKEH